MTVGVFERRRMKMDSQGCLCVCRIGVSNSTGS